MDKQRLNVDAEGNPPPLRAAWDSPIPAKQRRDALANALLGLALAETLVWRCERRSVDPTALAAAAAASVRGEAKGRRPPRISSRCRWSIVAVEAAAGILVSGQSVNRYAHSIEKRLRRYNRWRRLAGPWGRPQRRSSLPLRSSRIMDGPLWLPVLAWQTLVLLGTTHHLRHWEQALLDASRADQSLDAAARLASRATQFATLTAGSRIEPLMAIDWLVGSIDDPLGQRLVSELRTRPAGEEQELLSDDRRSLDGKLLEEGISADEAGSEAYRPVVAAIAAWLSCDGCPATALVQAASPAANDPAVVIAPQVGLTAVLLAASGQWQPMDLWTGSAGVWPLPRHRYDHLIDRLAQWPHGKSDLQPRSKAVPILLPVAKATARQLAISWSPFAC